MSAREEREREMMKNRINKCEQAIKPHDFHLILCVPWIYTHNISFYFGCISKKIKKKKKSEKKHKSKPLRLFTYSCKHGEMYGTGLIRKRLSLCKSYFSVLCATYPVKKTSSHVKNGTSRDAK